MSALRFELKQKAISLRKQGFSIREIENLLMIPRSTLSGWLKDVELTEAQKLRLKQSADLALIKARVRAAQWHRSQKELRLQMAKEEAEQILEQIKINDNIVELALAMLYLGEGTKSGTTAIGSSNPLILKFFLVILLRKYRLDTAKIRCDLHIRVDQDPIPLKKYWSKQLNLPLENFRYVVTDKRTGGKVSYPAHRGVCIINCGNVVIQRKLVNLYNLFCQRVINEWAISSAG